MPFVGVVRNLERVGPDGELQRPDGLDPRMDGTSAVGRSSQAAPATRGGTIRTDTSRQEQTRDGAGRGGSSPRRAPAGRPCLSSRVAVRATVVRRARPVRPQPAPAADGADAVRPTARGARRRAHRMLGAAARPRHSRRSRPAEPAVAVRSAGGRTVGREPGRRTRPAPSAAVRRRAASSGPSSASASSYSTTDMNAGSPADAASARVAASGATIERSRPRVGGLAREQPEIDPRRRHARARRQHDRQPAFARSGGCAPPPT